MFMIIHRGLSGLPGRLAMVASMTLFLASACHRAGPVAEKPAEPAAITTQAESKEQPSVKLDEEQVRNLDISVTPAEAISRADEIEGFAVVLSHDAIAQVVAEVSTAEAALTQSRAALARIQRLANTPGAFGADSQEAAQRQVLTDVAALSLAQRKLSVALGNSPAWKVQGADKTLEALANGQTKLIRVTFALGSLKGRTPANLRIAHLDPSAAGESWQVSPVWDATADPGIPGRSFFALLRESTAGEGERLQAWAAAGPEISGVFIPGDAVILSDSKYWCYVETQPGFFERRAVDVSRPMEGGYFVTEAIKAGDAIVTNAAGLLLSHESSSGSQAD